MLDFWNTIFPEGETGYVAIGLKSKDKIDPKTGKPVFKQEYIDLAKREQLEDLIKYKNKGDLYFCPSILTEPYICKANVKHSWVLWTDQDVPLNGAVIPSASFIVASGTAGHTHAYWRLSEPLTWSDVELRTRGLMLATHADPSGIDATQYLRIPNTLNHKTKIPSPVQIITTLKKEYKADEFSCVSADYYDSTYTALDLASVLLNIHDSKISSLLLQTREGVNDRSDALMHFAHVCAEAGLNDDERFTLLQEADERWGKFSKRDDRDLRLGEIVFRSTIDSIDTKLTDSVALGGVGWKSLSGKKHEIKWVIDRLLPENGLMFFTASSGVGKSTLAMNMAGSLTLKDTFLGFKITKTLNQKVMYASTEMDEGDVNYFLGHMNAVLPSDAQDLLEQGVVFYPEGVPIYLNTKEGQKWYTDRIEHLTPTGLVIDTLGASVSTSLTDEKEMRIIADWIDRIRKEYGIWVTVLHHYRKAGTQQRNERGLDDMYGAQLIANRAKTVLGLRAMPKTDNILEVSNHKGRFMANGGQGRFMYLRRPSSLWLEQDSGFSAKSKSQDEIEVDIEPDTPETELPI